MFITLQTTSVSEQRVSYCMTIIPINLIVAVCVCSLVIYVQVSKTGYIVFFGWLSLDGVHD